MKITSKGTDYALLLLTYLSMLPAEAGANVREVAAFHKISQRFLANIAHRLAVARIIHCQRGVGGGIKLARAAELINILEVIEAIDGPLYTMDCQTPGEICLQETSCHMKRFWGDIQGDLMNKLVSTTIHDLTTPYCLGNDLFEKKSAAVVARVPNHEVFDAG